MTPEPGAVWWDRVDTAVEADAVGNPGGYGWVRAYPQQLPLMEAVARACDGPVPTHRVRVQGARCTTVGDLVRTLGDALEFPWYFGQNLDAFDECFRDLLDLGRGGMGSAYGDRPGRDARRLVLEVADAELVLAASAEFGLPRFLRLVDRDLADLTRGAAAFFLVLYTRTTDLRALADTVGR